MPVARLASDSEVLDALPGVFAGATMLPTGQVVRGLRKSGLRLSADPEESLAAAVRGSKRPYYWLAGDEFLADGVAMVAGHTFTHALSGAEVDSDVLEAMPDLEGPVLDLVIMFGLRLPDGRLVTPFDPFPGAAPAPGFRFPIRLPGGVLSGMGLRPGDLIGLTGTGQSAPELIAVGSLDPDRLGQMLARRLEVESSPLPVEAVVTAALALGQWPDGVQPPISVAAAGAGLACADGRIAPLGVPLHPEGEGRWDADYLAEVYDLPDDLAQTLAVALGVVDAGEAAADELAESLAREFDGTDLDPDGPDDAVPADLSGSADRLRSGFEQAVGQVFESHEADLGEVMAVLADPYCALVVAEEALEGFQPRVFGLGMLVRMLDRRGLPRPARAAVEYLRGRQLELLDGPASAEAAYRACLDRVADHPGALVSLAGIAVDRSQYAAARSLFDRSGLLHNHPVSLFLSDVVENGHPLDRPGTVVPLAGRGRNQPCPCGSGRKYKVCHGRTASGSRTTSVREQAHQLYDKAVVFAKMRYSGLLGDLLQDVLDVNHEMADSLIPTVYDALLFNEGVLQEYLELRGDLLAPSERDLIAAWLSAGPSIFEVEGCEPGQWLELRDLRTGDRHRVTERKGSQQVSEHMLLYARVADVGDRKELYGGISVIRVHELDTMLDLLDGQSDAEEIIGYLLDRLAPPDLVTPEGDPIELCTATFTTTATVKLARELDELFTRDSPGTWTVTAGTAAGQEDAVSALASLKLTGRTLTLQSISRARAASVIDRLDAVQAKLSQTGFEVTDLAEAVADREGAADPEPPSAPSLEEDPAVAAAIANHVARYEANWVDTPIPALRGLTPRQAAADPTRREDLERLLAGFPSTGSPVQMDGQRLRDLLDL